MKHPGYSINGRPGLHPPLLSDSGCSQQSPSAEAVVASLRLGWKGLPPGEQRYCSNDDTYLVFFPTFIDIFTFFQSRYPMYIYISYIYITYIYIPYITCIPYIPVILVFPIFHGHIFSASAPRLAFGSWTLVSAQQTRKSTNSAWHWKTPWDLLVQSDPDFWGFKNLWDLWLIYGELRWIKPNFWDLWGLKHIETIRIVGMRINSSFATQQQVPAFQGSGLQGVMPVLSALHPQSTRPRPQIATNKHSRCEPNR